MIEESGMNSRKVGITTYKRLGYWAVTFHWLTTLINYELGKIPLGKTESAKSWKQKCNVLNAHANS